MDGRRRLDARFLAKGTQEDVGGNASAPTAQLHSLRVLLEVNAYSEWDSRSMNVQGAFLKPTPSEREREREISHPRLYFRRKSIDEVETTESAI